MRIDGRRWLALGALLVVVTAVAPAASAEEGADTLVGAAALRPFFRALAALDRHRTRQPVSIIQIGDSHTANDAFSGRMRERLQARFGAAGRGWLPAGVPFKYYRPDLVSVSESGWRHIKPSNADAGTLPFGLDASVAEPDAPDARMTLSSTDGVGFDRVAVEFVSQPHGAPLALRIDNDASRMIATAAVHAAVRQFAVSLRQPAHAVELEAPDAAGGGRAAVLGWATERREPGIVYENHGTIGATAALLQRMNPAAESFELAQRRPALLVVAFGTNEGFKDGLDLGAYAELFRDAVASLKRRAPGAAVLILGSPDANRLPPNCTAPGEECDAHATCSWAEPRNLDAVRDIQRRIARQEGWAFWDWSAAMGGHCSIGGWLAHEPPRAMPDHVHLNKDGYGVTADMLFSTLMKEYDRWKGSRAAGR